MGSSAEIAVQVEVLLPVLVAINLCLPAAARWERRHSRVVNIQVLFRQLALAVAVLLAAGAWADQAPSYEERDFLSRVRRLTVEGLRAGEGYWSSDSRRLVFQSEREPGNPFYQIYALDLTTGDVERVSPGYGRPRARFSIPGRATSCSPRRITIRARSSCKTTSCGFVPPDGSAATGGITIPRWRSTSGTARQARFAG